jgi:hypothetical protein
VDGRDQHPKDLVPFIDDEHDDERDFRPSWPL